jgi:hypothetical protein
MGSFEITDKRHGRAQPVDRAVLLRVVLLRAVQLCRRRRAGDATRSIDVRRRRWMPTGFLTVID